MAPASVTFVVDALPPIPDGTCISDIATDMADVMIPLRPNWYSALSAHAEHRVGARGPVWKLR